MVNEDSMSMKNLQTFYEQLLCSEKWKYIFPKTNAKDRVLLHGTNIITNFQGEIKNSVAGNSKSTITNKYVFKKKGAKWEVVFEGCEKIYLNDLKGIRIIAHLLANPYKNYHVKDLSRIANGQPVDTTTKENNIAYEQDESSNNRISKENTMKVDEPFDDIAYEDYKKGIESIKEKITITRENGDILTAEKYEEELNGIKLMYENYRYRGQTKSFVNEAFKLRGSIRKNIFDALVHIKGEYEPLYGHLDKSINKGYGCVYNPDPDEKIEWDTSY